MLRRFRKLWARLREKYIPLIGRPVAIDEITPAEKRQVLLALATHPGFRLLIGELHNRRVKFETASAILTVPTTFDEMVATAVSMARLEAERHWTNWLETEVIRATHIDRYLASRIADPTQIPDAQRR